jgi:hypothetical protein
VIKDIQIDDFRVETAADGTERYLLFLHPEKKKRSSA